MMLKPTEDVLVDNGIRHSCNIRDVIYNLKHRTTVSVIRPPAGRDPRVAGRGAAPTPASPPAPRGPRSARARRPATGRAAARPVFEENRCVLKHSFVSVTSREKEGEENRSFSSDRIFSHLEFKRGPASAGAPHSARAAARPRARLSAPGTGHAAAKPPLIFKIFVDIRMS